MWICNFVACEAASLIRRWEMRGDSGIVVGLSWELSCLDDRCVDGTEDVEWKQRSLHRGLYLESFQFQSTGCAPIKYVEKLVNRSAHPCGHRPSPLSVSRFLR